MAPWTTQALLLAASASLALALLPHCPNSSWVQSPAGDCFLQLHLDQPVTADQALTLCSDVEADSFLPETLDPETNYIVSNWNPVPDPDTNCIAGPRGQLYSE